ncbi:PIG-L family deacetylase [Kitasatospora sp. NPDC001664]
MRLRRLGTLLTAAVVAAAPLTLTQAARAAQPGAGIVQIVAHEDDDLLFMNPDLSNSIKAGIPITTVYLSAGEATAGVEYARQRQNGALAAYSQMLGVTCPDACWNFGEVTFGTHTVERYALGNVNLYFLGLHDGGADAYQGLGALNRIWNGGTEPTLAMADNGRWPQSYSSAGLDDVLTRILASANPTLVRIQDPAPDPLLAGELGFKPEFHGDNPDHTAAARFADKAVGRYGGTAPQRVVVEHYRDYNIQDTPANLSSAAALEKVTTFEGAYAPNDPLLPRDPSTGEFPSACNPAGASNAYYQCWESRQQYRTPRSTQSVISDRNGWLHAFAVESGKLFEWQENSSGAWTGPTVHAQAPGPLAAGVSVGRDQDGRIEVLGQRSDTGAIVSNYQTAAGGWAWGSLGSPNLPTDALQVSAPVAASNEDGRLQVFVRNAGGGISSTWQTTPNGGWSGWADMGGSGIQEAPAVFTTKDRRIELFGLAPRNAGASVLHWYQPATNQPFVRGGDLPVAPTSAPTVAMDQDGRLELLYRQLDAVDPLVDLSAKSYTMTLWQTSPGGGWAAAAGALGGGPDDGGVGAPAAVTRGDGRIVAFVRNLGGGISVSVQNAPNGAFGSWADLRGPGAAGQIVGVPATGVDRNGLADLVALGLDGRMYHNRQNTNGSFSHTNWQPIG